jgi:hypothetical protein
MLKLLTQRDGSHLQLAYLITNEKSLAIDLNDLAKFNIGKCGSAQILRFKFAVRVDKLLEVFILQCYQVRTSKEVRASEQTFGTPGTLIKEPN